MATVFISHSSKDRQIAETICDALESRDIPCWMASRDVGPGQNYQESIVEALGRARAMVLVFSENANNSTEVKKELALSSQYNKTVIPVRVEDVVPKGAFAYELSTHQWIDLFAGWEHAVDRLARQIRADTGIASAAPPVAPHPTPPPPVPPSATPGSRGGGIIAVIAATALIILAGGGWWLWQQRTTAQPMTPPPPATPAPVAAPAPVPAPSAPPPAAPTETAPQAHAPAAPAANAPPVPPAPAETPRPTASGESCAGVYDNAGTLRYCATSVLAPQAGNNYAVGNLFDGNLATAWVKGRPGSGIGEWIVVEFAGGRLVRSLSIANGYQKSSEVFQANSRVRKLRVVSSRGDTRIVSLDDRMGWQQIAVNPPLVGSWAQFVVEDVFPGSKYSDLALSELKIDSDAAP
jgi:hypothetical protein